jgi:hypothetical protein
VEFWQQTKHRSTDSARYGHDASASHSVGRIYRAAPPYQGLIKRKLAAPRVRQRMGMGARVCIVLLVCHSHCVAHMCKSAINLPLPLFAKSGCAPCTIGVPGASPFDHTPNAFTFELPPSVFEMPSVSLQNHEHHCTICSTW